jgi:hypothetical protein
MESLRRPPRSPHGQAAGSPLNGGTSALRRRRKSTLIPLTIVDRKRRLFRAVPLLTAARAMGSTAR